MEYFLGIDAGGSKTHALILDQGGKVRGFGSAGCGNHQVNGLAAAVSEIKTAIDAASQPGGITYPQIKVGCFCLSGADLKSDYELLIPAMQGLGVAEQVMLKNDTMAALRASITHSWGVAVICGSGFNAAARSPGGNEAVFPALGYISGDWGGGGQLSHEMIRLVMRAWDGRGEKTQLTALVLDALEVPNEEVLLEKLYTEEISERRLLHLIPLLFKASAAGDSPAQKLVLQLAEEVSIAAITLMKRLSLQSMDVEVGLAGGVFKSNDPLLIDTVTRNIQQSAPQATIRTTKYEPVVGAALLALESGGMTVDGSIYRAIDETLPEQLWYQDPGHRVRRIKTDQIVK
jgi:N-acetylglucosamine kinase-like BadF-type ATPase